jgi:hypothetical protein
VANLQDFLKDTYFRFGGHGTIRDDNNMKRRLHALRITFVVEDGLRVPVMDFREHDEFAAYEGGWNDRETALPIFKDIKSLASTLAARTLGQTDFIKVDMKPIKAKMAAILELLKQGQSMVAPGGRREGSISSGHELLHSTEMPKFFADLFEEDDQRWSSISEEVHSIPNNAPFTAVSLPVINQQPVPIPEHGRKILQALGSVLPTAEAIISGMEEPGSRPQQDALKRLKELVCIKGPEYKVSIAKLPAVKTGVYLYHQGNAPPSRMIYDPVLDLHVGQIAVVYMELSDDEKLWMGDVSFSLIRVDSIEENAFKGTYLEPSAKIRHYQNKVPWPVPAVWVSHALVPLQIKATATRARSKPSRAIAAAVGEAEPTVPAPAVAAEAAVGVDAAPPPPPPPTATGSRSRLVEYRTGMPVPVETVQFSCSLTQRRLIPVKFQKNVLEAVRRCNSGNRNADRVCNGIDEEDDDD